MTAWHAVRDVAAVRGGDRVLVHGAAGGAGGYAVQLAAHLGALVAATCSGPNMEYVRGLGADHVVDRRSTSIPTALTRWAPKGVDAIIDTVGQGSLKDCVNLTRRGGVVAAIGTLVPDEWRPDPTALAAAGVDYVISMSTRADQPGHLRALVDAAASGWLRTPHIEVFELDDVALAHGTSEEGHVRGKLLLHVGAA